MKKSIRELIHYIILGIVLTAVTFGTYFISTLTPFMLWIRHGGWFLQSVAWMGLAILYFITLTIFLIATDKPLHYLLDI